MRNDSMPEKDITLGEVYRAVLSLKEEFVETRKEIVISHNELRAEVTSLGLKLKEFEIKTGVLERQNKALEVDSKALEDRLRSIELVEPTKSTDPWARVGAAISGVGGLIYWWIHNGSGN